MGKDRQLSDLQSRLMEVYAKTEAGVERRQDLFAPSQFFTPQGSREVQQNPDGSVRKPASQSEIRKTIYQANNLEE